MKTDLARCCGPAHGVGQALLDLAHSLIPAVQHALVPLRVQQLGACVQPHSLSQGPHLPQQQLCSARHHNHIDTQAHREAFVNTGHESCEHCMQSTLLDVNEQGTQILLKETAQTTVKAYCALAVVVFAR